MLSASPAVVQTSKVSVKNLTDAAGNSINQSLITIPFTLPIKILDATKLSVRGFILQPYTGQVVQIKVGLRSATVDPAHQNNLLLNTKVLMEAGPQGTISIGKGALADLSNRGVVKAQLTAPKGQKLEGFTLANRAFIPTNINRLSQDLYPASIAPDNTSTHIPANTVFTAFKAFMDRKVAGGFITQTTENTAIARFNNSAVKTKIPDANLRAGMLSLYGTAGEPAIASMLDGANVTMHPQTIIDFSTDVSPKAEVAETLVLSDGRLRTLFKTSYAGDNFVALGAKLAHEACHQDSDDNLNEEAVVNSIETIVYAQQLLVDKSISFNNTTLVKSDNTKLLALLNSGTTAFPHVGLSKAPLHTYKAGVLPGANNVGGPYQSFINFERRAYMARGFSDFASVSNPTVDAMYANITGKATVHGNFDAKLISDIDKNQIVISDKNAVRLAGMLKCKVVA